MDKEEIIQLIKEVIRQEFDQMVSDDRFVFRRKVEFENDINIDFGRRIGTKIGTASDQLVSFFGQNPSRPTRNNSRPCWWRYSRPTC